MTRLEKNILKRKAWFENEVYANNDHFVSVDYAQYGKKVYFTINMFSGLLGEYEILFEFDVKKYGQLEMVYN